MAQIVETYYVTNPQPSMQGYRLVAVVAGGNVKVYVNPRGLHQNGQWYETSIRYSRLVDDPTQWLAEEAIGRLPCCGG